MKDMYVKESFWKRLGPVVWQITDGDDDDDDDDVLFRYVTLV